MRNFATFLIAILLMSSLAAAGPVVTTGEDGSTNLLLAAVSATLTELDAADCNHNCEYSPCEYYGGAPVHTNGFTVYGNDAGPEHNACYYHPQGCLIHTCTTFATSDLRSIENTLRKLPSDQVAELAATHANLEINIQRGAVQVYGCDDKVIVSFNLPG